MKVGDIFRFRAGMTIHDDIDKCIGIVLADANKQGQYKVQIRHKTLWVLRTHMDRI